MDKKEKFNNLDRFLEKFKNILPRDRFIKEHVQQVLLCVLNIKFERSDIRIQGKRVMIQCSPSMKHEMLLQQERILTELKKRDVFIESVG